MNRISWITVASLAALAVVLTILFHEAVHAVVCLLLGCEIRSFSAVHVNAQCDSRWRFKVVAGSASIANLVVAAGLCPLLRRIRDSDGRLVLFVWLLFLVNLLIGTGYWFASGVTNTGDWARVIDGWQPRWLYQLGLVILGTVSLMAAVAWALVEFGRMLEAGQKPIGRAQSVMMVCYATAFLVMLVVGMAQPGGPFAFPGVAGLMAVLGGLSPMLWMMQWFRAEMFQLQGTRRLEIGRSVPCVVLALVSVTFAILLTLYGQSF